MGLPYLLKCFRIASQRNISGRPKGRAGAERHGGITANLLTGLGFDELLTRTDSVGARGFLTNTLGMTIALADSAGVV
ncbi:MAG: hypothetical protein U0172_02200 [Nitrospiraceae bacterium]